MNKNASLLGASIEFIVCVMEDVEACREILAKVSSEAKRNDDQDRIDDFRQGVVL